VYSVGGANAAILAAFERARRPCQAFIGHDLDDDNVALLRSGRLSAVLHHDLHHDLHMACLSVMQAHGAGPMTLSSTRSNVEVITPFNLPLAFVTPADRTTMNMIHGDEMTEATERRRK
jgi:LacI family transcriptional regulator